MNIRYVDNSPEGKARRELIEQVLPKEQITGNVLSDKLLAKTKKLAIEMLLKEIEIYRAYPKSGKLDLDAFTPRNSRQCFMGQGFKHNGSGFEGWYDADLTEYRRAVGTIPHPTWGNCTILEIWGGDHFEKHPKMVKEVMEYGWGLRDTLPKVKFYVNPFVKNKDSGTWDPDPDEVLQEAHRAHMIKIANYCEIKDRMQKAGVKSPMELAVDPKDDPVKKPRRKSI